MNSKSGITIVEILVTISVMAILSSILIIYNRTAERQLILFKEQARLVSTLNRAKGLAMALFREIPPIPCGYGVHISSAASTYLIFRNLPDAGGKCDNSDNEWSGPGENFGDVIQIDKAVEIDSASTTLQDVFFIPPDPKTIINNITSTIEAEVVIKIKGSIGSNRKVIKVNKAVHITTD